VLPRRLVDPTGVGDAYRAGFITGMRYQLPWPTVGRMASLAAAYVLEEHGTQRHRYTLNNFIRRYNEHFNDGAALEVLHNSTSYKEQR
jgi:adenosine kinase